MTEKPTYEELAQRVRELEASEVERKRTEEELNFHSLLLSQIQDQVTATDLDGNIIYVNATAAKNLKCSKEDLIGKSVLAFGENLEIRAQHRQILEATLDKGQWRGEVANVAVDGKEIVMDCRTKLVRGRNNAPVSVVQIATDITERVHTQQQLHESNERLSLALETARLGYWRWSADTNKVEWFGDHAELFGIKDSEFRGSLEHVQEMVHPDDREMGISNLRRAVESNLPFDNTYRVIHPDGSIHWLNSFGHVSLNDHGKPSHIFGITRDISEFKFSEERLRLSEARYKMFFEQGPDGVVVIDPSTGRIIEFNDQACRQLGYERDEFSTLSIFDIDAVESKKELLNHIQKVIKEGRDDFETKQRTKHNEIREVHVTAQAQQIEGEIVYHCIWRDITDKKQAEMELIKSREQYALAVRGSQDGIWDWDLRSNSLFLSQKWKEMIGYTDKELPNEFSTFENHIHPDDKPKVMAFVDRYLQGLIPVYAIEFRFRHQDGTYRWILARGEALRNEKGIPYRMAGSHTDITERKNAEEKMRMMVQMLDNAPSSITVHDYEGRFLYANRKTFALHGYEEDEFMRLNLKDIDVPESRALIEKRMQEVNENGEISFQVSHFRKNGTKIPLEVFLKVVNWNDRPAMLSIATDITDRMQSEIERNRLIRAIEQAGDIIVITNTDGSIQYVNPAFEKVTGYDQAAVMGQNPRILKSGRHDEAFYKDLWDTITNGKTWSGRLTNKSKSGRLYSEEATISPVYDSAGSIVSYVAVKRDITQALKFEQQLRNAQKMESIGSLAGGIAHDFNNILFPIVGLAEMLMEDFSPGSVEYENAQEIFKAGRRGSDLVKQILAFSRQAKRKRLPVRIQQVLKEVMKLSRATIPTYIELVPDIQQDCGMVLADPTQIHQIAMNIITNAYHATEESGGKIIVSLQEKTLTAEDLADRTIKPGRYAQLSITDNGHGMPPELTTKIFDPYFTTKEQGKGTGLGLAVVYGIVKEHKGDIHVSSEVGKGTVFSVRIPIMENEVARDAEKVAQPLPTGSESILLVDDEPAVVELERRMLQRLGYRVAVRINSLEALNAFQANPGKYHLVVSDMAMPVLTGIQLAEKIREIDPAKPIILCSGYSEKLTGEKVKALGINAFLMKPVLKAELAKAVRKVLDDGGG